MIVHDEGVVRESMIPLMATILMSLEKKADRFQRSQRKYSGPGGMRSAHSAVISTMIHHGG